MTSPTVLVTGAFGFIGGAIAGRLVDVDDVGRADVRSLTRHPAGNRSGERIRSIPYDFAHPERMAEAFAGVDVFVNTFYVRFNRGGATFERAVEQSRALVELAQAAGVKKIVHVSVSRADEQSDLPYYRHKALIERLVRESGLDYTILRPAVVVGPGDILVNNIAYFLRRVPVFAVFGRGAYRVQPMTLDAFADVAVEAIGGAHSKRTVPVAGPADWSFLAMVSAIRDAVGSRAAIVRAPTWATFAGVKVAAALLSDVVLTRDEVLGLTEGYLCEEAPLRRGIDFRDWLAAPPNAAALGRAYVRARVS